ncbi:DUF692 domain-containing protein [bacterium]|nr:DUF692 domain-containing protein [bacterium]
MGNRSVSGFGIGLRPIHYGDFFNNPSDVDFVEIISENFMLDGGRAHAILAEVAEIVPVIPHGVSLSIGSSDDIDWDYLNRLKRLVRAINPPWVSDHLCWSRHHDLYMHNLLPVPQTPDVAVFISEKARIIQDYLEVPLLLENVSSYVTYTDSTMTEWDFLSEIVSTANCYILLDINNVVVSGYNHGFNPIDYITALPRDRVKQHHLAGYRVKDNFILDSHDNAVSDPVWELYRESIQFFDSIPVVLERDDSIPPWNELIHELTLAKKIYANATTPIN